MKCYVLIVSSKFPAAHPKAGQPTNFEEQIGKRLKKHTLRGNYTLWKKRFDNILAGKAYLSVREWSGKPYASPQRILWDLYSRNGIGIQKCTREDHLFDVKLDDGMARVVPSKVMAMHDGLSLEDFNAWFRGKKMEDIAIIHFTSFRY